MATPYVKILKENSPLRFNCVLWARKKVPSLPYGLWTFEDKKKIETNARPRVGDIAVVRTNQTWGHVAVVTYVGKMHITIQEANFYFGKVTERHNTAQLLRIHGYFHPKALDKK